MVLSYKGNKPKKARNFGTLRGTSFFSATIINGQHAKK